MCIIEKYIDKLILNLPKNDNKRPINIDLVMDGGAFNGSYLIGCLHFLKKMENIGYIKIKRISGCSISSFIGLHYLINRLDNLTTHYTSWHSHFIKKKNFEFILHINNIIPIDYDLSLINHKLYITYNNVKYMKKIVIYKYKNTNDTIETIIRSSFIPFLINGEMLYKKKYIDGCTPYLFSPKKNREILYLNLINFDKIYQSLNVSNEKTNYGRIMYGILDIYQFYGKEKYITEICSYYKDWTIIHKIKHYLLLLVEKIIIITLYLFIKIELNKYKYGNINFTDNGYSRIVYYLFRK